MDTITNALIIVAYRRLALAIFRRAVRDVARGPPPDTDSALDFLIDTWAADLAESLGLARDAPRHLADRLQTQSAPQAPAEHP